MTSLESNVKKIVMIGDGGVGKTSLLMVFKEKVFNEEYIPTIFDNYEMEMYVEGQLLVLSLIDTAGQEEFDRIRLLTYPNTDAFVLCFDVTNPDSFENITTKWIPELRDHCDNARILLIGTKSDLRGDKATKDSLALSGKEMVSEKEAERLCSTMKAAQYIECSARTGQNVQKVFEGAAHLSLQTKEDRQRGNNCCQLL